MNPNLLGDWMLLFVTNDGLFRYNVQSLLRSIPAEFPSHDILWSDSHVFIYKLSLFISYLIFKTSRYKKLIQFLKISKFVECGLEIKYNMYYISIRSSSYHTSVRTSGCFIRIKLYKLQHYICKTQFKPQVHLSNIRNIVL